MTLFFLACTLFVLVLWILRDPLLTSFRRARIRATPFPAEWREHLRRRVPYFRAMPADLQLQLKKHMQVFLAEKPFIGCRGLEVTEEMRVTIAAQACLLLLNRRTDYFPTLKQVLVYPGPFVVDREATDAAGLVTQERRVLSGESWSRGQVILSWDDVLAGAATPGDGSNVVIHEFAHQLDEENGAVDGAPLLIGRLRRARWTRVLSREFAALQHRLRNDEPSLIGAYAATNPGEFFAVVSETFFERPGELAREHPSLYSEFSGFYRVNPLSW
jgi:Mlc titration factor MtfA (ptsG expression regulator)